MVLFIDAVSGERGDMSSDSYFETRLSFDKKREVLWKTLTHFFNKKFGISGAVLELGAGHGDFINNVNGDRKFALDLWHSPRLNSDVEFHQGSVDALGEAFATVKFDVVFSSNLLEHLSRDQINKLFREVNARLKPGGLFINLLPNYRLAYANYFDDYTHLTPISDVALVDWLTAEGFQIKFVHPGFLPFSIKGSRMPVKALLIKLWLASPWKPGGKQMLIVASKK